eukprot:GGOE01021879.1.p4 GENE.GGOE01021879.1~~GGOE01021879.1.p4  ORF type:complete len:127 (+),score=4.36 GGOE01021879.1:388-768(+)
MRCCFPSSPSMLVYYARRFQSFNHLHWLRSLSQELHLCCAIARHTRRLSPASSSSLFGKREGLGSLWPLPGATSANVASSLLLLTRLPLLRPGTTGSETPPRQRCSAAGVSVYYHGCAGQLSPWGC